MKLIFCFVALACFSCFSHEVVEVALAETVELKKQPIIIQVYTSENCAPCIRLKRILNELGASYTEQDFWQADKDLGVSCTPTMILYRGHREIGRLSRVEWTLEKVRAFLTAADKQ